MAEGGAGLIIVKDKSNDNTSNNKHHASSRYDPRAMNRIDNIDDLIDEGDDSDSSDEGYDIEKLGRGNNNSSNGVNMRTNAKRLQNGSGAHESRLLALRYRRIFAITSLVAIIIGASVAIGMAVTKSELDENDDVVALNVLGGSGSPDTNNNDTTQQQTLLEMAERVIQSCSEHSLDRDMSECQNLCHSKMCCFEEDEMSEYSCQDDDSKECAVYAGCEALVQGSILERFDDVDEEG